MPKVFGKKKIAEPALKSHWPIWLRALFETLRDIPWLPLTAIGTFVGVLHLSMYFRSIDYFPSDISTLVGLGAYSARSRTRFHADGGQHSAVMADSIPHDRGQRSALMADTIPR